MHRRTYDILDEGSMNQLAVIIADGDCDMWGALPGLPWSTWQYVNLARYGEEFKNRLGAERIISAKMVEEFFKNAEQIIETGRRVGAALAGD